MERLTERFSSGQAAVKGCGNNCKWNFEYCGTDCNCPTLDEIYEKLAKYEEMEEQGLLHILTQKEKLLKSIDSSTKTTAKNSMGCLENWYDPYYVMKETFKMEEIQDMSEETIDVCVKALCSMSEGLYR